MAEIRYTLDAKSAKAKIGGLIRSKKNPYTRHTEGYAKKNVEKLRKEIKKVTGMTKESYQTWMKGELKARKTMGMSWSDYDLYLQAKINKSKLVSKKITDRVNSGEYIDTTIYKQLDTTNVLAPKSVFTPEVTTRAFFSLPENYEKSVEINGKENYTSYIVLREMKSGQQAETMVNRHIKVSYDKTGNLITDNLKTEKGISSVVMTKSSIFRENYIKALNKSLSALGPEGVELFLKVKAKLENIDDFEFESIARNNSIPYIYEEGHVRGYYQQVFDKIMTDIERIEKAKKKGGK